MDSLVELKPHPLSLIYPDMSETEYAEHRDSIRERGLNHPITLFEGMILDGRHRYRACLETGVEPRFDEFDGDYDAAAARVDDDNLHRRHLNDSQRAIAGAKREATLSKRYAERRNAGLKQGDKTPESRSGKIARTGNYQTARDEAAAIVGVSPRSVADAKRVIKASPEVGEQVARGEKTLQEAKRELGIAKPKPKPKPSGKTIVNGVEGEDPEVERMRAAGIIPEGATAEVEGPPAEESLTVADLAEAQAERKAIEAEVPDDEWIAALPLSGLLQGPQLSSYQSDAIFWRHWNATHHGDAAESRRLANKHRPKAGAIEGEYTRAVRALVIKPEPKHWLICPPHDQGGCGGTGHTAVSACPKCRGRGYFIPYQPPAKLPR